MNIAHFKHSMKHGPESFEYYIKLPDDPGMTWNKLTERFRNRYDLDTRRAHVIPQSKSLKIHQGNERHCASS